MTPEITPRTCPVSPLADVHHEPYYLDMATRIDFSKLTVEERLDLIGEIWDSVDVGEHPGQSAELLAELERRAAEAVNNPEHGKAWETVRDDILKRLR